MVESIRMYGHDIYYLPRTRINDDLIRGEETYSRFDSHYFVEMYITHDGTNTYLSESYFDSDDSLFNSQSLVSFASTISSNNLEVWVTNNSTSDIKLKSRIVGFTPTTNGSGSYKFKSSSQPDSSARNVEYTSEFVGYNIGPQIDVVGIRLGVAILIDCKHWNKYSISSLNSAVSKQIERTKMYVEKTPGSIGVPVIVTLSQDKINFIENVPIVPITKFSSFIDEFYGHLDEMETIERN